MGEAAFFFELHGKELFAVLHAPKKGLARTGVVLCHALGEEKLWSQRVYVNAARDLAQLGYAVLRFDFRGEGESDEEFAACGIASRVDDALRAVEVLRELAPGTSRVFLLGHRLGAAVAAAAAACPRTAAAGLVAWDPIGSGSAYLAQLLRAALARSFARAQAGPTRAQLQKRLEAGETVTVAGYGIGPALYRELAALEWERLLGAVPCPSLVLDGACEAPFWRETARLHRRAPTMMARTVQWLEARPS